MPYGVTHFVTHRANEWCTAIRRFNYLLTQLKIIHYSSESYYSCGLLIDSNSFCRLLRKEE